MKFRPARVSLLCALWTACGDDSSSPRDAGLPTPLGDASVGDASASGPRFTISVANGSCGGECEIYTLDVDQAGRVRFAGATCTARPGVFDRQIPVADAQAMLRALSATNYFALRDSYVTEQDGCTGLVAGARITLWKLELDGKTKSVSHYHGCRNFPELAPLDALEDEFRRTAGVTDWIGSPQPDCGPAGTNDLPLGSRYRLSLGAQVLGVLSLDAKGLRWILEDCARNLVAIGTPLIEPTRWALLADSRQRIELPNNAGVLGSIVLDRPDGVTVRARGLRDADQIELTITPSENTCL